MSIIDRITGRQDLLDIITDLRRELRRLKEANPAAANVISIAGLEDMVLQVNERRVVDYVNSAMATALRRDRALIMGHPLAEFDNFAWGPGLLDYLVEEAQSRGEEISRTREFFDPARGRDVFLVVKARPIERARAQILIQDRSAFERYRRAFERCVAPRVIEKMVGSDRDFFLAEREHVSIVFADLRGFSAMSENLLPEEVRTTLNDYLETVIEVLDKHDATVDHVAADEVMAVFGAPVAFPDHAARALAAAREVRSAHRALRDRWAAEGKEIPPLGVGVNTGEAVAGFIGCRKRADYTVIGHAVNLAQRLCEAAGGGQILTTVATAAAAREQGPGVLEGVDFVPLGKISVRGMKELVEIVDVRERTR